MNKKILFIIGSLQAGGAERVASRLCDHWAESEGFDVILATGDIVANDFYQLSSKVKRISFNFNYSLDSFFGKVFEQYRRFFAIQSIFKEVKPDIIILSATDISIRVLFNLLFSKKLILVCEHNNYFAVKSKFKRICRLLIYRKAEKLLLLTERDIENYTSRYFSESKILVMPNPLGIENNHFTPKVDKLQLVAVGRLCEQKAFHRLVKIFKRVNPKYILKIVGEGPERENLQTLISEMNLTERIELVGHIVDMSQYYKESTFLLMTSIYEGLPMVIGEANAFGLPVVAFDCPTGPAEMIINGKNGYLIEDGNYEDFINCVNSLVDNTRMLETMSLEAFNASKKYSIKYISSMWSSLIGS